MTAWINIENSSNYEPSSRFKRFWHIKINSVEFDNISEWARRIVYWYCKDQPLKNYEYNSEWEKNRN